MYVFYYSPHLPLLMFWLSDPTDAKLHLSYTNIDGSEGGSTQDALIDLTGGIPEEFSFADHTEDVESGRLYQKLLNYHNNGHLLCCAFVPNKRYKADMLGIHANHAYAIMSVRIIQGQWLIQLRNPYGGLSGDWKGAYSDSCELWSADGGALLRDTGYQRGSKTGVFWMTYHDFVQRFNVLHIVRVGLGNMPPPAPSSSSVAITTTGLPPIIMPRQLSLQRQRSGYGTVSNDSTWESFSFRGRFENRSHNAGGSIKYGRWRENTQYSFIVEPRFGVMSDAQTTVGTNKSLTPTTSTTTTPTSGTWQASPNAQKTKFIIVMSQEDVRMTGNKGWYNDIGFYILRSDTPNRRYLYPLLSEHSPDVVNATFTGQRCASVTLMLPPGYYVLIPCTDRPSMELSYVLDVYVSNRNKDTSLSMSRTQSPIPVPLSVSGSTLPPMNTPSGMYRETSKGTVNTLGEVRDGRVVVRRITSNIDWKVTTQKVENKAIAAKVRAANDRVWIPKVYDQFKECSLALHPKGPPDVVSLWHCRTCDSEAKKVCCRACMMLCHNGHDLVETVQKKSCDCGAGIIAVCLSFIDF
jgi:hypothetical protein